MRFLSICLVVTALVSCNRAIAPQSSTDKLFTDSIRVDNTSRDTTIIFQSVVTAIHDTIPCPGLQYDREQKEDGQTVTIKAHDGILDVTCKSDSLQQVIHLLSQKITEKEQSQSDSTIVITKTVDVPVTHTPGILWWSLAANVVLLVCLYFCFSSSILGAVSTVVSFFTKFKL